MCCFMLTNRTLLSLVFCCLTASALSQSSGWHQWAAADGGNDHWYEAVVNGTTLTWDQAEADSVAQGGYLATLTSQGENDFVYSLVDAPQYVLGEGPWLGGFAPEPRSNPADGWQWVTGEAWSYTNWGDGQPSNTLGIEDRLCFQADFIGNRTDIWNDFPNNANQLWNFQPGISSYVIERNTAPSAVPEPASMLALAVPAFRLFLKRKKK
jgi:hypothetical protein